MAEITYTELDRKRFDLITTDLLKAHKMLNDAWQRTDIASTLDHKLYELIMCLCEIESESTIQDIIHAE